MKKFMMITLVLVFLSIAGAANAGNKTGPFIGGSLGYANTGVSEGQYNFDDEAPARRQEYEQLLQELVDEFWLCLKKSI